MAMQKIPIERIRHRLAGQTRPRTSRACDLCRRRKTKCDGRKPTCTQCEGLAVSACVYSEGKVSQDRRRLESATLKIKAYEELLRDIKHIVNRSTSKRITNALTRYSSTGDRRDRRESSASSSSVGSLEGNDIVSEDLNRSEQSRATGYIGKNSEVAWLQRLDSETAKQNDSKAGSQRRRSSNPSIASLSYHLNQSSLASPQINNMFTLPSIALANRLLNSYFDNVHYSLPVVRQALFLSQCRGLFIIPSANPGKEWLAIFYMILAIGSQFCQLSGQGVQDESLADVFFACARTLNHSENIVYEHNNLQQLQVEALMTFYLLSKSQINRAWKMVGIAARSGVALGLHLRRINNDLNMEANEARKLLWWSIFYLEHLLSSMTGRASCLTIGSISTQPPLPFEIPGQGISDTTPSSPSIAGIAPMQWSVFVDDGRVDVQQNWLRSLSLNTPLYFHYLLDLCVIAHSITNRVYSSIAVQDEPHEVEKRIKFFSKKLGVWLSGLNPSLTFEDRNGNWSSERTSRPQVSLALCYYSTRVMLHRPCVSRPIANQKTGLRVPHSRFHEESASSCLRASMILISILPDQPDLAWIYAIAPWWSIVHFLMQANIVLLSHISFRAIPAEMGRFSKTATKSKPFTPAVESPEAVFDASKKALRWLHCLGSTNASAAKAFELCYICICRIASSAGLDLGDVHSMAKAAGSSAHAGQSFTSQTTNTDKEERETSGGSSLRSKSNGTLDQDGDLLQELVEDSASSYLFPMQDMDMDMAEFIFFDGNKTEDGVPDHKGRR